MYQPELARRVEINGCGQRRELGQYRGTTLLTLPKYSQLGHNRR